MNINYLNNKQLAQYISITNKELLRVNNALNKHTSIITMNMLRKYKADLIKDISMAQKKLMTNIF